jgi:hypothetical protein
MPKRQKKNRTSENRIKSPRPGEPSWTPLVLERRLPMPILPTEHINQLIQCGLDEASAIATVLYQAFQRCVDSATEKDAGNDFLVLLHPELHNRLNDLRNRFIDDAMKAGLTYQESAGTFDAITGAAKKMVNIAKVLLFPKSGRRNNSKDLRKRHIDPAIHDHIQAMSGMAKMVAYISQTMSARKPGLRLTYAQRKARVERLVHEIGRKKGVKTVIKAMKDRGFKERPQTTRKILRELKEEGKFDGAN